MKSIDKPCLKPGPGNEDAERGEEPGACFDAFTAPRSTVAEVAARLDAAFPEE